MITYSQSQRKITLFPRGDEPHGLALELLGDPWVHLDARYHSKSVGFAEPSVAPRIDSPNAHSCPAKDLAVAMIHAFVREFARTAHNVKGGHKALWSPRDPGDEDRALMRPEDITLNLFGTTRFTLHKDAAVLSPDQQKHSGAWLLEQLSEEEKACAIIREQT